ncbi:MAG: hypothetical protein M3Q75_04260 [Gemmatimonadota bacterium]|nr:hypothetical protein [Gemmatimonadota bacterium]
MCMFGKAPKAPPPPAQLQPMVSPKDMQNPSKRGLRRRGMWASIMTSPQGIPGAPTVTGSGGGVTGG